MSKQKSFNQIAKATIKALKEQADVGKVNDLTTEAVYVAIENAFTLEYAKLFEVNDELKDTLRFIANGENLDADKMQSLAQQTLAKLQANK
mgnify:CR=1 FL=1